jgi:Tfp pilus assembly protein FimT
MMEMTAVLVIGAIMLSISMHALSGYNERLSARRAAEVFSRDLTLARAMAVRSRENVVVKFNEAARTYTVRTASGRELANRRYGSAKGDLQLTAMDLVLPGDSLAFSARGLGTLANTLGTATFRGGRTTWRVQFNPMGASKLSPL